MNCRWFAFTSSIGSTDEALLVFDAVGVTYLQDAQKNALNHLAEQGWGWGARIMLAWIWNRKERRNKTI